MLCLTDFTGFRAASAADGLTQLLRVAIRAGRRHEVPGVVVELLGALHAAHLAHDTAASATRSDRERSGSLDGVRSWRGPREAGAVVGLSDRRVQQLCAAGLVSHRRVGARALLVDVADLRRHLRGEPA